MAKSVAQNIYVQIVWVLGTGGPHCGNPCVEVLLTSYFKCWLPTLRTASPVVPVEVI